jgi:hypothetical protein
MRWQFWKKDPSKMTEDEIVEDLIKKIPGNELDMLAVIEEEDLIHLHMTTGAMIRNEYKLWERTWQSKEDASGIDYSPDHPDAVSDRIIHKLWERARF